MKCGTQAKPKEASRFSKSRMRGTLRNDMMACTINKTQMVRVSRASHSSTTLVLSDAFFFYIFPFFLQAFDLLLQLPDRTLMTLL